MGNINVVFTGCESLGYKCKTPSSGEGEIVTNPLSGSLVWEKFKKKVAIDLVPQSGEWFVEFTCGPATCKVKGSVMANVPVNKSETKVDREVHRQKGQTKAGILLHGEQRKGHRMC